MISGADMPNSPSHPSNTADNKHMRKTEFHTYGNPVLPILRKPCISPVKKQTAYCMDKFSGHVSGPCVVFKRVRAFKIATHITQPQFITPLILWQSRL